MLDLYVGAVLRVGGVVGGRRGRGLRVARRARGGVASRAGVGGPLLVVVGVGVVAGAGVALLHGHAARQDGRHVEQRGHASERVVLAGGFFASLFYFAEFYT